MRNIPPMTLSILPATVAPHLSPIIPDDEPLYSAFFAREAQEACYANSWMYITQACRGLGLG